MAVQVAVFYIGAAERKTESGSGQQGRLDDAGDHDGHAGGAADGIHLPGALQPPTGGQLDAETIHDAASRECQQRARPAHGLVGQHGHGTGPGHLPQPDEIISRGGLLDHLNQTLQGADHLKGGLRAVGPIGVKAQDMARQRPVNGAHPLDVQVGVEAAFDLEHAVAGPRPIQSRLDALLNRQSRHRHRGLDTVAKAAQQAVQRQTGRQTQQVVKGQIESAGRRGRPGCQGRQFGQ